MKFSARGFTLVELLVALAILAIVGVFSLANFRSFGEENNLKNASLEMQTNLRLAQANASSGVKCQNQTNLGWLMEFPSLELKCRNSGGLHSVKTFPAFASTIQVTISAGNCTPTFIEFTPLYGSVKSICGSSPIRINFKNTKTNNEKNLIIEQGGRIYVQ